MKKDNRWTKFRHKVVVALVRPFFALVIRSKYHIQYERFREEGKRPYLVVFNHQTAADQFFVSLLFRQHIYYIASEDIFSLGFLSKLLRYAVAPIPIKKQTTDLQAVKTCIRVAREGGSIGLAPEGNRTYHGRTVYIKPAIASLAKKLALPIAIVRIENGYGVQPRWSDVLRKGTMRCYVKRVVEPEEYGAMSKEELDQMLIRELTVDEGCVTGQFHHKNNAEFLERAIYTCPKCGLAPFESRGDIIRCTKCGMQVRHLPTKELEGVEEDFPHRFVADWYDWQCDYIRNTALPEGVLFEDRAALSRVNLYKSKTILDKDAAVQLYRDKLVIAGQDYPFADLGAITVLGKNKLNIYTADHLLQLKGNQRFNALKYVNFYHKYKNESIGENNGQFLGL